MPYFALIYDTVDDYVNFRAAHRDRHLALANQAVARGELLFGGAFAEPVDGALLIFQAADKSVVETFAQNDPYVINGLVARWEIRPWNVVVGAKLESSK
jgi:uncharacterized protein YciI